MPEKIPDFILVRELLKEKMQWEIERTAMRAKIEEQHAEIIRLKREGVAYLLSDIDEQIRRDCRKETLYKNLKNQISAFARKNKELNAKNKQLAIALFEEKQKNGNE